MNGSTLRQLLAANGLFLQLDQIEKLLAFADLLSGRGVRLGLIARSDAERVLERHVVDSLRAVPALQPGDRSAYDLGSGAGLPGIPVAIATPALEMTLVESRRRRAGWLEAVLDQLRVDNASIVNDRIEQLA